MKDWLLVAQEKIPSLSNNLRDPEIDNPMALWIALRLAIQDAYVAVPPRKMTIDEIWAYAIWCDHSNDEAVTQALYCSFYEHLLDYTEIARDLPNRMSLSQFDGLRECLMYHNSVKSFTKAREIFEKT